MRINPIKITGGVTVKLAVRIEDYGRNPDGGCAERLDVIEFLFRAFEVAAMDGSQTGGGIISVGVVVGGVAVEETVRHDLINTLRLPEGIGTGLGGSPWRAETKRGDEAAGDEPGGFFTGIWDIHDSC